MTRDGRLALTCSERLDETRNIHQRIEVRFQSKLLSNWMSKLNMPANKQIMKYPWNICMSLDGQQSNWKPSSFTLLWVTLPVGPVGPRPATSTVPHGWCSGWLRPPRTAPWSQFMGHTPRKINIDLATTWGLEDYLLLKNTDSRS